MCQLCPASVRSRGAAALPEPAPALGNAFSQSVKWKTCTFSPTHFLRVEPFPAGRDSPTGDGIELSLSGTAMSITRKRFLGSMAGGTVVLLFQACGGGSSYSGGTSTGGGYGNPMPTAGCGSSGALISGNHGHMLTVSTADLDSMIAKTYGIMGTALHDHTVTLTPAQLAQLKAGQSVTVTSTVTDAAGFGSHSHDVTVTCM